MKYELGEWYPTYTEMPCGAKAVRVWMKRDDNSASDWCGWLAISPVPDHERPVSAAEPETKYVLPTGSGGFGDAAYLRLNPDGTGSRVLYDGKEEKYDPKSIINGIDMKIWRYADEAEALQYVKVVPPPPDPSKRIAELEQSLASESALVAKLKEENAALRTRVLQAVGQQHD